MATSTQNFEPALAPPTPHERWIQGAIRRKEKEAGETDLSQTLSAFPPPLLLLVYDHGTDVYGKNARDKTLE